MISTLQNRRWYEQIDERAEMRLRVIDFKKRKAEREKELATLRNQECARIARGEIRKMNWNKVRFALAWAFAAVACAILVLACCGAFAR